MSQLRAKLWREPFIWFLPIGAVFALGIHASTGWLDKPDRTIIVSEAQIRQVAAGFSQRWKRPPTDKELSALIRDQVLGEILYREAKAMGLDQDDEVIRRRLGQKLQMLMNDASSLRVPTDVELNDFLKKNADRYRIEPEISFQQVFLDPHGRPDIEGDAKHILDLLAGGASPETLGDQTDAGHSFRRKTPVEISRLFDAKMARELIDLEPGKWMGPVYSDRGVHVVRVLSRTESRLPKLKAIRALVEADWVAQQRLEAKNAMLDELRRRYKVVIATDSLGAEE